MNERSQMQGGKNRILLKEIYANRFIRDSHWLEIWKNHFCPTMGPTEWRERGYGLWTFGPRWYIFNSSLGTASTSLMWQKKSPPPTPRSQNKKSQI
jgi:hypothetical protein